MRLNNLSKKTRFFIGFFLTIILVFVWQLSKKPSAQGDWQTHLAVLSTAEFNGDLITIKNVRNFRYGPTESDMHPAYYDKTYDLSKLKQVWYVTEPFKGQEYAAHTFLSFEFEGGEFLSITIEARKTKNQSYSVFKGMLRTYPLIYIAADERDVVLLRANLRKDDVYVYPVNTTPEKSKMLLKDMLERMNEIAVKPVWYNTFSANCTSSIAYHINKITPGKVPFSYKQWLTGNADELALELGLLDTELPLEQARAKYKINAVSEQIGDSPNYSLKIRGKE